MGFDGDLVGFIGDSMGFLVRYILYIKVVIKTRNMVAEWWYYGEIVRLFRIDSAIFMFFSASNNWDFTNMVVSWVNYGDMFLII